MDLGQVLDRLYQSEINFMIYALWDRGITVKVGDELNGFNAETVVRTNAESAKWLDEQVRKLFPKSEYVTGKTILGEQGSGEGQMQ